MYFIAPSCELDSILVRTHEGLSVFFFFFLILFERFFYPFRWYQPSVGITCCVILIIPVCYYFVWILLIYLFCDLCYFIDWVFRMRVEMCIRGGIVIPIMFILGRESLRDHRKWFRLSQMWKNRHNGSATPKMSYGT
jgi:hypothetical protein